jgi:hypothetical protein
MGEQCYLFHVRDHLAAVRVPVVVNVGDLLAGTPGKLAARALLPVDVVDAVCAVVVSENALRCCREADTECRPRRALQRSTW